jgi:hypothetical protein
MAEGVLVFTTTLVMWTLTRTAKSPWLNSIPAALAFAAKQSLAPLAAVGALAAVWPQADKSGAHGPGIGPRVRSLLLFSGFFLAIVILLHPFLWNRPIDAGLAALRARQALASAQVADRTAYALDTPGERLISLVGSLYLTPPMFAETGNYVEQTRVAETAYLANPLHALFRGTLAGALMLILDVFGFLTAARLVLRADSPYRRSLVLLLAATALQSAALLALVPLPWQRYYMPLVPFSCLWIGFAVYRLSLPAPHLLAGWVQRITHGIPQKREGD